MLWLKAFHIIFVVTWFAGLFYLPRLFVYHAMATEPAELQRLQVMEKRLFGIMTVGGMLAVIFGLAMIVTVPAYLSMGWLKLKLGLVGVLMGYHARCYSLMRAFRAGRNLYSHRWYRWFNEAPGLLLIAIVLLAVLRPF